MFQSAVIILGLVVFEVVSSIDNAIVNAHILKTLDERFRRFFLVWGLIFAVFLVRGVLPFLIVWLANTELGIVETAVMAFTDPKTMEHAVEHSRPMLLLGGGVYLFFVFLGWLFTEDKQYAFLIENLVHRMSVWFHAVAAVFMATLMWFAAPLGAGLVIAAQVGAAAYFVTEGFRKNAEQAEEQLQGPTLSAWSKLLYLEVLDASFSIDGVIGAFAFTMSVPLILLGNGIGALVVREITIRGIDIVSKFVYLKNGAMYSIGVLGMVMMAEGFHVEFPFWAAPGITLTLLVVFMAMSWVELRRQPSAS